MSQENINPLDDYNNIIGAFEIDQRYEKSPNSIRIHEQITENSCQQESSVERRILIPKETSDIIVEDEKPCPRTRTVALARQEAEDSAYQKFIEETRRGERLQEKVHNVNGGNGNDLVELMEIVQEDYGREQHSRASEEEFATALNMVRNRVENQQEEFPQYPNGQLLPDEAYELEKERLLLNVRDDELPEALEFLDTEYNITALPQLNEIEIRVNAKFVNDRQKVMEYCDVEEFVDELEFVDNEYFLKLNEIDQLRKQLQEHGQEIVQRPRNSASKEMDKFAHFLNNEIAYKREKLKQSFLRDVQIAKENIRNQEALRRQIEHLKDKHLERVHNIIEEIQNYMSREQREPQQREPQQREPLQREPQREPQQQQQQRRDVSEKRTRIPNMPLKRPRKGISGSQPHEAQSKLSLRKVKYKAPLPKVPIRRPSSSTLIQKAGPSNIQRPMEVESKQSLPRLKYKAPLPKVPIKRPPPQTEPRRVTSDGRMRVARQPQEMEPKPSLRKVRYIAPLPKAPLRRPPSSTLIQKAGPSNIQRPMEVESKQSLPRLKYKAPLPKVPIKRPPPQTEPRRVISDGRMRVARQPQTMEPKPSLRKVRYIAPLPKAPLRRPPSSTLIQKAGPSNIQRPMEVESKQSLPRLKYKAPLPKVPIKRPPPQTEPRRVTSDGRMRVARQPQEMEPKLSLRKIKYKAPLPKVPLKRPPSSTVMRKDPIPRSKPISQTEARVLELQAKVKEFFTQENKKLKASCRDERQLVHELANLQNTYHDTLQYILEYPAMEQAAKQKYVEECQLIKDLKSDDEDIQEELEFLQHEYDAKLYRINDIEDALRGVQIPPRNTGVNEPIAGPSHQVQSDINIHRRPLNKFQRDARKRQIIPTLPPNELAKMKLKPPLPKVPLKRPTSSNLIQNAGPSNIQRPMEVQSKQSLLRLKYKAPLPKVPIKRPPPQTEPRRVTSDGRMRVARQPQEMEPKPSLRKVKYKAPLPKVPIRRPPSSTLIQKAGPSNIQRPMEVQSKQSLPRLKYKAPLPKVPIRRPPPQTEPRRVTSDGRMRVARQPQEMEPKPSLRKVKYKAPLPKVPLRRPPSSTVMRMAPVPISKPKSQTEARVLELQAKAKQFFRQEYEKLHKTCRDKRRREKEIANLKNNYDETLKYILEYPAMEQAAKQKYVEECQLIKDLKSDDEDIQEELEFLQHEYDAQLYRINDIEDALRGVQIPPRNTRVNEPIAGPSHQVQSDINIHRRPLNKFQRDARKRQIIPTLPPNKLAKMKLKPPLPKVPLKRPTSSNLIQNAGPSNIQRPMEVESKQSLPRLKYKAPLPKVPIKRPPPQTEPRRVTSDGRMRVARQPQEMEPKPSLRKVKYKAPLPKVPIRRPPSSTLIQKAGPSNIQRPMEVESKQSLPRLKYKAPLPKVPIKRPPPQTEPRRVTSDGRMRVAHQAQEMEPKPSLRKIKYKAPLPKVPLKRPPSSTVMRKAPVPRTKPISQTEARILELQAKVKEFFTQEYRKIQESCRDERQLEEELANLQDEYHDTLRYVLEYPAMEQAAKQKYADDCKLIKDHKSNEEDIQEDLEFLQNEYDAKLYRINDIEEAVRGIKIPQQQKSKLLSQMQKQQPLTEVQSKPLLAKQKLKTPLPKVPLKRPPPPTLKRQMTSIVPKSLLKPNDGTRPKVKKSVSIIDIRILKKPWTEDGIDEELMGPIVEKENANDVFQIMKLQQSGINFRNHPTEITNLLTSSNEPKLTVIGNTLDPTSKGVITTAIPIREINNLNVVDAEKIASTIKSIPNKSIPTDSLASKHLKGKKFQRIKKINEQEETSPEHIECSLVLNSYQVENFFQAKGSAAPNWFPGMWTTFPDDEPHLVKKSPSEVLLRAWNTLKPEFVA